MFKQASSIRTGELIDQRHERVARLRRCEVYGNVCVSSQRSIQQTERSPEAAQPKFGTLFSRFRPADDATNASDQFSRHRDVHGSPVPISSNVTLPRSACVTTARNSAARDDNRRAQIDESRRRREQHTPNKTIARITESTLELLTAVQLDSAACVCYGNDHKTSRLCVDRLTLASAYGT